MTLSQPLRNETFFLILGLAASAALHSALFLSRSPTISSQPFAVQPSAFSIHLALLPPFLPQPSPLPPPAPPSSRVPMHPKTPLLSIRTKHEKRVGPEPSSFALKSPPREPSSESPFCKALAVKFSINRPPPPYGSGTFTPRRFKASPPPPLLRFL